MQKMINRNLKRRVITEANNIKKYATAAQKDWLNFKTLDPGVTYGCIYGRMTGDCFNEDAYNLIIKCTSKPFSSSLSHYSENYKAWTKEYSDLRDSRDFTPIEFYIMQEGAKNKNLIDFIKGEKETLKESDL